MTALEQKYNIEVVYEDNHVIAINKKAGQIAQGDKTGDTSLHDTVKAYLKEKYNKPGNVYLGLIHRLDRPSSGGLLFGKTSKASARLSKMFQDKTIEKTYWIAVDKAPPQPQGRLEHCLWKDQKKNKSFVTPCHKAGAKKAVLNYKLLSSSDQYHLLEIHLETGRHHQIRAQMHAIGCHIKGDVKYGFRRANKDASIHLHARSLQFIHPVSKATIAIRFPLPKHDAVWSFFAAQMTEKT